jgi:hypothetical protein
VTEQTIIVGASGSSGLGWSELKDIECTRRYAYIKQREAQHAKELLANPLLPRVPTAHDEAFQGGIFMHAARAKWFELDQDFNKQTLDLCNAAGRDDCIKQNMPLTELSVLEYSVMFCSYANYWAIRPKVKPYAVELYLDYNWHKESQTNDWLRSTRYDDVGWYPDAGGYCIGEFKTTYSLAGALKYYTDWNPQILLQWLIYERALHDHPEIKGTMIDIWDKGKNRGTRHFIPVNTDLLPKFEVWVKARLNQRRLVLNSGLAVDRNFFVCNTFNDAYSSQCAWKERCQQDE